MATNYTGTKAHAFLQLSNHRLGVYNAWDSNFTARLVPVLLQELRDLGQLEYYHTWVQPLATAVVNMQRRGMLVDRGALNAYRARVRKELAEADRIILNADTTHTLRTPSGKSPNGIGSPLKLRRLLFETLELKSGKKTDKGVLSTDQESLAGILKRLRKKDQHARPVLEQLFHRSRLKTISQRYLNLPIDHDGRVRASVNMAKVKTWRFSYDNPALQQYPPECRHIFKAAPGCVFLAADFSALEARILAFLSGDQVSIDIFQAGGDVHARNARDLFGYSLDEWEALDPGTRKLSRNFAKTFLYGIAYGAATETLKLKEYCPCPKCIAHAPQTLNMNRNELKKVEVTWYKSHYAVEQFHAKLAKQVREHKYWDCPLGGRRIFSSPWGPELDRESKNAPMQTTAASKINRDQVLLDRRGMPIVLQKHDELMAEVRLEDVNKYSDMFHEVMEAPLQDAGVLTDVVFPIEIEIGDTWGSLEAA